MDTGLSWIVALLITYGMLECFSIFYVIFTLYTRPNHESIWDFHRTVKRKKKKNFSELELATKSQNFAVVSSDDQKVIIFLLVMFDIFCTYCVNIDQLCDSQ